MSRVTTVDGPVAVTGASGYIGSQVVAALLKRGYVVRACVTDPANSDRTQHLLQMSRIGLPGRIELRAADVFAQGSYDSALADCSAVLHVATPMGYAQHTPRQIFDGAIDGTANVLSSVRKSKTVRRFVYTSSFAAIVHPAPAGYRYTENDWASDTDSNADATYASLLPKWDTDDIDSSGGVAYMIAKVASEKLSFATAEEDGGFDAMSVCPNIAIGPLLSRHHGLGGWQRIIGRMLEGKPCNPGWQHLWNIIDVRDIGETQARIIESDISANGDRYLLAASDSRGEISVLELQSHLRNLFPEYEIGGPPGEFADFVAEHGGTLDAPHARSDKARTDLGLLTHSVEDTLYETGKTMVELGLVEPKLKKELNVWFDHSLRK